MRETRLLMIDAVVNLILGVTLLLFPIGLAQWLGIPIPESPFYPSILGAVLVGIGFALLLERYRHVLGITGLDVGGALVINLCGSGALIIWLVVGDLGLPSHGYLVLWSVAILVFGIGLLELINELRHSPSYETGKRFK
jgi:hypothetical protein